jgi:hypothetical protein
MSVLWEFVCEIQVFGGKRYQDECGMGMCGRDAGILWGEVPRWVWYGHVWERCRDLVGRDTEMSVVWACAREIQGFGGERYRLKGVGLDGKIILK